MKKLKRIFIVTLVMSLIVASVGAIPAFADGNDGIMPIYNNTASTSFVIAITDNGILEMEYLFSGFPSCTTKIVTTTYVEKKVWGIFWKRVDLGITDNQWVDTINDYFYTKFRSTPLWSTGTYRVTCTYVAYGTGGSPDEIEHKVTATY